ncbi:Hypothetical predicted protein [Octopus vulgaris]|uniref:Uncharacterized protein n=1 Tax=Octopus vulgaris TaxID=6645 RepID=A0AA36B025_OCTVU|nr:Hypothetical predicted protein [Octopus vulgaris]
MAVPKRVITDPTGTYFINLGRIKDPVYFGGVLRWGLKSECKGRADNVSYSKNLYPLNLQPALKVADEVGLHCLDKAELPCNEESVDKDLREWTKYPRFHRP